MRNKILISLVSFVSLFFLFQVIVQAGGCCFKEVSLDKKGTAGISPALINGRLYSMAYIMEKKEPKYKANQTIQAINSQSPNVKCKEATTDSSGRFVMECASSQAGSFPIEVKPLAANDEAGGATPVTVIFKSNPNESPQPSATPTPTPTVAPTATPTPTPEPTPTPSASPDPVMEQRIVELEAKIEEQEKQISRLESMIKQLGNLWGRLFRWGR